MCNGVQTEHVETLGDVFGEENNNHHSLTEIYHVDGEENENT